MWGKHMAVYKDQVGVVLTLATGLDLAGATKMELHVVKPDGTTDTWTAEESVEVPGSLTYTTEDGDLDQAGGYIISNYVEWGTDSKQPGDPYILAVLDSATPLTYTKTPTQRATDAIRLKVGDTAATGLFTQEEYDYLYEEAGSNIFLAAANACEALAARYAPRVSQSHGDGSLQLDQLFQHYTKLADKYRAEYSRGKWSLTVPATGTSSPNQRKIRDSIDSNYPSRMLISDVQPQEYGTDEVE